QTLHQFKDTKIEDIDRLNEVKDVRWSLDDSLLLSNKDDSFKNENDAIDSGVTNRHKVLNPHEQYFPKDFDEKSAMKKAMLDSNIQAWRDVGECQHAMNVLREIIKCDMSVLSWSLTYEAEKWAVLLASRLTDKTVSDKVHLSRSYGDMGQLIYYAEGLFQGPGCNMAITAWLRHGLGIETIDSVGHLSPLEHGKVIGGHFKQLLWQGSQRFGAGISYNNVTRSGFVVMFFKDLIQEQSKVKIPTEPLQMTFWQLQLPGYRNALFQQNSIETNLGYTPCYSRMAQCDDWAKEGQCQVPALQYFMHKNCFRSCTKCILDRNELIDGGWST
uniref:ShKT domain-containing protein n=2 Tax=Clytia hemisphaerica TaxID=252671 RepID=A0A7M5V463_9CNID